MESTVTRTPRKLTRRERATGSLTFDERRHTRYR
jgi:hypothetical protein